MQNKKNERKCMFSDENPMLPLEEMIKLNLQSVLQPDLSFIQHGLHASLLQQGLKDLNMSLSSTFLSTGFLYLSLLISQISSKKCLFNIWVLASTCSSLRPVCIPFKYVQCPCNAFLYQTEHHFIRSSWFKCFPHQL